jgi:hypothetical protein
MVRSPGGRSSEFYASIFKDLKIGGVARYPEGAPGPAGKAMTVDFELFGQTFRRRQRAMRVAEKQIRLVVADHPEAAARTAGPQGSGKSEARNEGHAPDEKDRDRGARKGRRLTQGNLTIAVK